MQNTDFLYIDTSDQLAAFCNDLREKSWIVLDTEFIREKTFLPELCLIQIKAEEHLAVVDTLKVTDLSGLSALLQDSNIIKVFHAGSQDLEIFYWLDKTVPSPLFDTQVAAPVLGFNEQIGYGNLVQEYLGIELEKAHSRADWSRRPLPDNQIAYALDDVIFLEEMYLKMRDELTTKKRLAWIQPEFEAMTDSARYNKPPSDRWKKMRAAQRMKGPALSILQALTEWREAQAQSSNIPRTWLMKDDIIASLAREMPETRKDLDHIRGLQSKIKSRHADALLKIIHDARSRDPQPMPATQRKKKLRPDQQPTIELLQALVAKRAFDLDINAGVLASRKDLEACVAARSGDALKGWRHSLIADDISELLNGNTNLRIESGTLVIKSQ